MADLPVLLLDEDGNEVWSGTLAQFCDQNPDEDADWIEATLAFCESVNFGGGAAPSFTLVQGKD